MKNKTLIGLLAVSSMGTVSSVYAFNTGDVISFKPGESSCESGIGVYPNCSYGTVVQTGSYFAMDVNGNGKFSTGERIAIAPGTDGGIIIGALQPITSSHGGCPNGTESNTIDAPWCFFENTGMHQTVSIPVTDNGNGTLDFRGWSVAWAGITNIPLGGDPANFPVDTGNATVTCTHTPCNVGDTYSIDYTGHVPLGDPSGFGGVWYQVHLESGAAIPTASISIAVAGGNTQECSSIGGSSVTINATTKVPVGDAVSSVSWTIDSLPVGNALAINPFLSLGSHAVSATVTTVNGLTAFTAQTIQVKDTQAPSVKAAFLNVRTLRPVTKITSRDIVEVQAEATDVCNPAPVVKSMVGANMNDGDRLSAVGRIGSITLNINKLDLTVTATDASNNSATANSSLTISP